MSSGTSPPTKTARRTDPDHPYCSSAAGPRRQAASKGGNRDNGSGRVSPAAQPAKCPQVIAQSAHIHRFPTLRSGAPPVHGQLPYTIEGSSCARSSTDRASDYGSEGWGFESLRARQRTKLQVTTPPHLRLHRPVARLAGFWPDQRSPRGRTGTTTLRSVADPGNFTEVDECCLTCGQAADVFSWLALSRAVVRTQCGPSRPGGTGLGRALNTGS